eukprot:TRINITY_DN12603_c0_g1_i1.p1 TRINITY_DN12603_c0_g1~~TRINITY_DN12603_c0_g1_i1.p1  ORF type:complete len:422 (-),score=92.78 TRINITY_DN12603_c0_g1_i1:79-1344(-)
MFRSSHRFLTLQPQRRILKRAFRTVPGIPGSGIPFGLVVVSFGIVFLVINERRRLKQNQLREKGFFICEELDADATRDENFKPWNKKLVRSVGHLAGEKTPEDTYFHVSQVEPTAALKLSRDVEMYQWIESVKQTRTKSKDGSEAVHTCYSYTRDWSSQREVLVGPNPPGFNPDFPLGLEHGHSVLLAQKIGFGKHKISLCSDLLKQVNGFVRLTLNSNNCKYLGSDFEILPQGTGLYSKNKDPNYPTIGDIKVSFSYVPEGVHSVVSKYDADRNAFVPFEAKLTKKLVDEGEIKVPEEVRELTGGQPLVMPNWVLSAAEQLLLFLSPLQLCWIARGNHHKESCFEKMKEGEQNTTLFLRLAGTVMVVGGCVIAVDSIPAIPYKYGAAVTLGFGIAFQTIKDAAIDGDFDSFYKNGDLQLE